MKKYILLTIVFIYLISCDHYDMRLKIINKSNQNFFYSISINDSIYPSSPLRIYKKDTILEESSFVSSNTINKEAMLGKNSWEYFVKKECENGKIRIFFFKDSLILNTKWDSIYKYQIYTEKMSFNFKELEKLNWEIKIK